MQMTPTFTVIVQAFFEQHLVAERGLSSNTILSYRDTMRLLLEYLTKELQRAPDRLTLEDFDTTRVRQFLDWLETSLRHCTARTRNQRLAAIKAFFRYVATRTPEHLDRCRQIRDISAKRVEHKTVRYLEESEMQAILKGIAPPAPDAVRDQALLTLMYNSGARVSEIVGLNVLDLRLGAAPKVRVMGKGQKERDCPLWSQTVELLRQWLKFRGLPENANAPLFVNARGERLTRSGIAYILKRAAQHADLPSDPTRPKNITPHVIRHTTAMHLLTSGVDDITVISAWPRTCATQHNSYLRRDQQPNEASRNCQRYDNPSRIHQERVPYSIPHRLARCIGWWSALCAEVQHVQGRWNSNEGSPQHITHRST